MGWLRAVVGVNGGLRVRSRRGWDMTRLLPELAELPFEGVLDGELVAFNDDGVPQFPLVCRRLLHGDRSIPLVYMVFDVLEHQGRETMRLPYSERRVLLEGVGLEGRCWRTPDAFEDGEALFVSVCRYGLEGIVAKRLDEPTGPASAAGSR